MREREPQKEKSVVWVKCQDCSWKHRILAQGNNGVNFAMKYANEVAEGHERMFDHRVEITIGS